MTSLSPSAAAAAAPGAVPLRAPWRSLGPALLAVLLGFGLRVANLGGQSLWYDEAFSLLLARNSLPEIVERTARDTMPPLYYWLLHVWGVQPPYDFYPRFLSVLAGVCSIPLVFAVARRLLDARAAAAAALFTAIAPFQVYFGQEVRMYSLAGLWSLLAVYGFLLGWRDGRAAGWWLYGLATALALYTHALGWLPGAAVAAWAAPGALRNPRGLLPPALALAGAFVLYLPWLFVVAAQAQWVLSAFWAAPPILLSPLASFYLFFEGPFAGPAAFAPGLALVLLALGLTLPAALRGTHQPRASSTDENAPDRALVVPSPLMGEGKACPERSRRDEGDPLSSDVSIAGTGRDSASLRFLWAWLALPVLALLAVSFVRSLYIERVLIGTAFPLYILFGWIAASLQPAPLRLGIAGGLVVLAGWGLGNRYLNPSLGKPPQAAAVAAVRAQWQPGQPVIHTSDGSYLPFLLYAPDLPNRLLLGDPEYYARTARARSTYEALSVEPWEREAAVGDAQRVLLVVARDHSVNWQDGVVAEFDAAYRYAEERDVGGILIRTYERR